MAASTEILAPDPAVKELQEYLNELDNGLADYRQKLEQTVARDSAKMPLILARLQRIRKFVRKSLEDI